MSGDWNAARLIIDQDDGIIRAAITRNKETTLHIAVAAKHKRFVKNLLTRMEKDDLKLRNQSNNTALCFAAASGIKDIAKMMVDMNPELPLIEGNNELIPLHMAALFGHRDMVMYLYSHTDLKRLSDMQRIDLFHAIISADIFDIALRMLEEYQILATSCNGALETGLHLLARKPSVIGHRKTLNFFQWLGNLVFEGMFHEAKMRSLAHKLVEDIWNLVIQKSDEEVSNLLRRPTRLLFDAASCGNVEFLVILIRSYPDLIWKVDRRNRSLFHIAAINRHETIFNIIYELGAIKDLIASYREEATNNTLLHLVARLPPHDRLNIVSGAALQMQREILWFKAVKKIVPRSYIKSKNKEGEVAQELFTNAHKELRKEGEKWMKDTATSCMLVATLIATVVFAAAFTVPGGNKEKSGLPIFQQKKWFNIFILSDAVALCSSSTSIVIFLSILTSRYAEDDFLVSLPSRLMFGFLALFVSLIAMVLAFCATLFLIYDRRLAWNLVFIISLASITAFSFALLHVQLWFDTLRSAYWSKFLFQHRKHRLH
ncbi:Ankyrin repeat-containing protein ITN1 [Cardamine amara subsp. amara]|uniref:Ankyrin repeat-containing protein ITN1 n=1 Tax=Cardamine amara subsp. amara TaxID=228776 RepID=A0ABD1C1C6_CARAN